MSWSEIVERERARAESAEKQRDEAEARVEELEREQSDLAAWGRAEKAESQLVDALAARDEALARLDTALLQLANAGIPDGVLVNRATQAEAALERLTRASEAVRPLNDNHDKETITEFVAARTEARAALQSERSTDA